MLIRGPFIIPRIAPMLWRLDGQRWRFRMLFPGAYCGYNRKPPPKRRRERKRT